MADGTRLSKIESELTRMDAELRDAKEQRQLFQERIDAQFAKMMTLLEKQSTNMDDRAPSPITSSSRPYGTGPPSASSSRVSHRDLPTFDGENVDDWLFRLEEYFDLSGTPSDQRVKIASFSMIGPAYSWYKWMIRNHHTEDWTVFMEAVQRRFGTDLYDNPQEALKELKQTGSLQEYQSQLENLSTKVQGLSEAWQVSFFIAGLNDYLKCQLRLAKPASYPEAVALARLHDQNHTALQKSLRQPPSMAARPFSRPKFSSTLPPSVPSKQLSSWGAKPSEPSLTPPMLTSETTAASSKAPFKHFTAAELRERRRQGLCYYCDEKYNPSHNCRSKCYVLLAPEDLMDVCHHSEDNSEVDNHTHGIPEISFNALSGDYHPRTLRLKGYHHDQLINILVDSGSSFNFIQPGVAQRLGLSSSSIAPFKVYVGSGDFIWCNTISKAITILVQGVEFQVDLYHLAISGADMVFGLTWLRSLGRVLTDYNQLTMEFIHQGIPTTLHAEQLLHGHPLNCRSVQKLLLADHISSVYHLHIFPDPPSDSSPSLPDDMQQLVGRFASVFQTPQGLPPRRDITHQIELQPGSKPIHVRPYKYPHFQKAEIERLVSEMLQTGIIRDSTSSFSSPVLLVKKKDGSWRFCVDYRALNAITIRDLFPMPTIEEILDELHGAVIFSKLDLRSGYHQIRMHETDTYKTAFRTHNGHYEFLVMPFGLTNAPSTFQATMNKVFKPFLRQFVAVFFDDILIYSKG